MPEPLLPRSGWTGLLLAGGRSTRMGSDKAALPSSKSPGQTLFEEALVKLQACCGQVLVLGGEQRPENQDQDLFYLADAEEDAGPLRALADALRALTTDWCLVLPLDMPGIPQDLLVGGMERLEANPGIAQSGMFAADRKNRGCFPLWLHRSAAAGLRLALQDGEKSLFRALFLGGVASWNPPMGDGVSGVDPFTNLNTPRDLEAWNSSRTAQGAKG